MTHYVQLPTATMALSTRLQAKLDATRAERAARNAKPHPRAFTRLHAVGVAFGLLAGGAAFLYGAQHPTNTLPPTPVIVAEPAVQPAEPPALTMADLVPAKPVKCNPYASNGTYLPELCGEHDAFADRAARVSRPE